MSTEDQTAAIRQHLNRIGTAYKLPKSVEDRTQITLVEVVGAIEQIVTAVEELEKAKANKRVHKKPETEVTEEAPAEMELDDGGSTI